MASIKDVAKAANTSISSVSRYFNRPDLLSDEKRRQIEVAIQALEYTPSPIAKSMRTKKTFNIALIVPSITNMYYVDLYGALRERILEKGYMVNLYTTERDGRLLAKYLKDISHRQYDGTIICFCDEPELDAELEQAQADFPLVLITSDPNRRQFNNIFIDARDAIFKATSHLIEIGRRNIAFVCGHANSVIADEKFMGYKLAMQKYGREIKPEHVFYGERNHFRTGFMAVREFVTLPVMPDGIVCIIDDIAIGCVKYLLSNGYKVPGDVAVIGFNGIKMMDAFEPSISTVQQPLDAMADSAIEMLLYSIDYPRSHKKQSIFMADLAVRSSTVPNAQNHISINI